MRIACSVYTTTNDTPAVAQQSRLLRRLCARVVCAHQVAREHNAPFELKSHGVVCRRRKVEEGAATPKGPPRELRGGGDNGEQRQQRPVAEQRARERRLGREPRGAAANGVRELAVEPRREEAADARGAPARARRSAELERVRRAVGDGNEDEPAVKGAVDAVCVAVERAEQRHSAASARAATRVARNGRRVCSSGLRPVSAAR